MLMKSLKTPGSGYGKIFRIGTILVVLAVAGAAIGQSNQSPFPRQMAWTAYNLGTTGYNQAVAIGAMLREKYNLTLRVIPGQNDVSRLLPLRTGRVDFTANGVATYFAQEGVFQLLL